MELRIFRPYHLIFDNSRELSFALGTTNAYLLLPFPLPLFLESRTLRYHCRMYLRLPSSSDVFIEPTLWMRFLHQRAIIAGIRADISPTFPVPLPFLARRTDTVEAALNVDDSGARVIAVSAVISKYSLDIMCA